MFDGAYVYILRCADGSYYTGTARQGLEQRVAEHNAGHYGGYTATRRPVELVFSQWFERITDAIAAERQIKGWSRAKKEALIRGDFVAMLVASAVDVTPVDNWLTPADMTCRPGTGPSRASGPARDPSNNTAAPSRRDSLRTHPTTCPSRGAKRASRCSARADSSPSASWRARSCAP